MSTQKQRRVRRLMAEQGGKCFYCRRVMNTQKGGPHNTLGATLEHIWPVGHPSREPGKFTPVAAACWECNVTRGAANGGHNYMRRYWAQARDAANEILETIRSIKQEIGT